MTPARRPLRELVQLLALPAQRQSAADAMAKEIGAQRVLLCVKDPQLDLMLPAPGMPKTLAGGPRWRAFLHRCLTEPRPVGTVDLPAGEEHQAQAVTRDGAALIVFADTLEAGVLDELEQEFALLSAVLNAQQALRIEHAEAAEAREQAARASALAKALDAARAASAELNLQLRREHERKDEFLAMLAHELRNPLAPLVNSIEVMRRSTVAEDRTVLRQLDVMARQLQQLTRVVDDLLDVSRVSRGLIELRRERLPLEEVLEDAIEAVRPLLEDRGHHFQRSGSGHGVYINADRVRMTQVFVNLLTNAAKYTEQGGRIALSLVTDQHRVSAIVQDSGIGIPQHMLARVFDIFAQVPSAAGHSQGGLGVGLTLVRQLVEMHGGRVSAYSRGEGHGSTFTVSLPQVAASPAPRPQPAPAAMAPGAAGGARVLVVDDNRDGADSMAAVLNCMGAQAQVAHDAAAALALAPKFRPDLILLDIGLPGIDGYETARRLRSLPGPRARLVALTGYGSPQDRRRALEAGFDDHLVKPLSAEATQALLEGLRAMKANS